MDENLLLSFEDLERTHWWFVVRTRLVLETIARACSCDRARVLEVGCGTGGLLSLLAERYPQAALAGVEPSAGAVAAALRRGCNVDAGMFDRLPRDDSSVDLLLALDVLEHCADDIAAAHEAYRVLAPGAPWVLTVPALPSLWGPHDEANAHHRRYTRKTLSTVLKQAGFEIERVTYFNTLLLPVGYLSRWVARLTGSRAALGVNTPVAPVNAVMRAIFSAELPILRHTDMPIGMSLLAVVRKPEEARP